MNISDPIADMLTRIRNASRARHTEVSIPASQDQAGHRRASSRRKASSPTFAEATGGPTQGHHHPAQVRGQGARGERTQAHQQARPPGLRLQDRDPACAGRARRGHRQHQPGHHDRRSRLARASSVARSWPTSGRRGHVTSRQAPHQHPLRRRRRRRRQTHIKVKGPKGTLERDLTPALLVPWSPTMGSCASSVRTMRSALASSTA